MRSLKVRHCLATLCTLSLLFCAAQEPALSSEVSYISFEVPGALGTYPMSINASMVVTGYYYTSPTSANGFLREPDGAITTFEVPGSVWTEPESINSTKDIAGFYEVVPGIPHGFIRYQDGRILTFNPPPGNEGPQAQPVSINDFGVVAGNYPYPNIASTAFARSRAGVFTEFGFALGADYPTVATGLNASGTIVGYFSNADYETTGLSFIQYPDGSWINFSVPLEEDNYGETTIAQSINADGTIAGWYSVCFDFCVTRTSGGFVRTQKGIFTVFNPLGTIVTLPGAGPFDEPDQLISAPSRLSINEEAIVTGSYTDAKGAQHGFVRNPYGTITPFDPPRGGHTTATCINDSGVIAGSYYYDWNPQISVGFIRLPESRPPSATASRE